MLIIAVAFLKLQWELARARHKYLFYKTGEILDKKVQRITEMACIVAEYATPETPDNLKEIKREKLEKACAIISDVMLQVGINPKDYNIEALVRIQWHITTLKKQAAK